MGAVSVLGLSGSLRKASFNTAALHAAQELAPIGMTIEIGSIADIPIYNEDIRQKGLPQPVDDLRARMRAADAILIATPEYNYSTSGVLKNAIDWASRPPEQPFHDKPIGIIGCSPGVIGTARAQYHLRQCFVFLDARVMSRPEIMIGGAASRFDENGRLTDEETRKFLAGFLEALHEWTERMKG